jgi:hypothetical protein
LSNASQSYENHAKMVPMYHYVGFGLIAVPVLWRLYVTATDFSVSALMSLLFGVGVLVTFFFARVFPLGVQDRVIRLEERARLERLMGADRRDAIEALDTELLIGLRYADDGEVVELFNAIVAEGITNRDEVKKRVKTWRADHQRI